jgi:hypothetical protein
MTILVWGGDEKLALTHINDEQESDVAYDFPPTPHSANGQAPVVFFNATE